MIQKFLVFLYISAILLLTSCSSTMQVLKETVPVKSAFHESLASYYLEFSEEEADGLDWLDSEYFAEKGLIVARGGHVDPEPVENWDIPHKAKPALKQARQYLVEILTPDVRLKYPELAAKSLFSYDCWVEQQEENASIEEIEICREDFYENLDMLYTKVVNGEMKPSEDMKMAVAGAEDMAAKGNKAKSATSQMMAEDKKMVSKPVELFYEALFDFDKHNINKQASAVIKKMFSDLKEHKQRNYKIRLSGHADRVGTEKYNMGLSKKRADVVKKILLKVGIPSERIELFAFGETDPKVVTADGIRHPQNRRVEIEIRVTPN